MQVEIFYFEGCPGFAEVLPRVKRIAADRADVKLHRVDTPEAAERVGFLGSPTVRVDGVDIEPGACERNDYGMKCRLYRTDDGQTHAPPDEWIGRALDRAT
jgi:hypothetical protein